MSDKPQRDQRAAACCRPRGSRRSRRPTASGSSRCSRWTRASGRSSTRCSAAARSTTRWSCSPPTTASSTGSTGSAPARLLPYEPALRVPLLMRGPGIPPGLRLNQLVTNADLAQTIVDAAGVTPGRIQDGRSLLELAEDPSLWWGRELLIEGGDRNGLTFAGPAQLPLLLRRVRDRRARALRPGLRPRPAREPPLRPQLRDRAGRPGAAARGAARLQRPLVPGRAAAEAARAPAALRAAACCALA